MESYDIRILYTGYANHTTPYRNTVENRRDGILLRLQVKGSATITLNGTILKVGPGDLVFVDTHDKYQLAIDVEPFNSSVGTVDSADYFLACDGSWVDRWKERTCFPSSFAIEVTEELLSLWRKLIYEKRELHEDNSEMIACITKLLLLTIERMVSKKKSFGTNTKSIAFKVKQYIEMHATEPVTLAEIANDCGVSISSACHSFKQAYGQSPMRYMIQVRLAIACDQIAYTDIKLEDIAIASGFRSYPYFSRAFRSRFRLSPSQFREYSSPKNVSKQNIQAKTPSASSGR